MNATAQIFTAEPGLAITLLFALWLISDYSHRGRWVKKLKQVVGAAVLALLLPAPSHAQFGNPYSVTIAGLPLTCRTYQGQPVRIITDPTLQNVGIATRTGYGEPLIVLNPNVINQYSPTVAVWWFAHECGHKALPPFQNTERNADCFGVRNMRYHGLITSLWQLQAFRVELQNLAGSPMGHLPGPLRAQNIVNCALT